MTLLYSDRLGFIMEVYSSEEELVVLSLLCEEDEEEEARRPAKKRRFWVHPINQKRQQFGEFHHLFADLERDPKKFFQYFRMSQHKFNQLLDVIKHHIQKNNTKFRRPVAPDERLAVCLRFLATGDSFKTIASSYRLGESTVRTIVYSCCRAIWQELMPIVLPLPTKKQWEKIEENFRIRWNYPNCCGALDGKHVVTDKPPKSGSLFFNYKQTFSVILMALVDADYKFISISVGGYGKDSDAGIFANSPLGKKLTAGKLDLPDDKPLAGFPGPVPHVFIGDEGFPLQDHLMRPYPRKQVKTSLEKQVYNYRHSRARRIVENCFGILVKRFRLYQRKSQISPDHLDIVVAATCCLHNFLRTDTCYWTPEEEESTAPPMPCLENIIRVGGNPTTRAMSIRNKFAQYFMSENGSVPWQLDRVRRQSH